jgi:hypothetical protein
MRRREEVDDWREFRRNHPGKWWKYHSRVWRSINIRAVAIAYCEQGFEIIPLWSCSKSRVRHEVLRPRRCEVLHVAV